MVAWESDTLSTELREQFWGRVVDYEAAPLTSHLQQLARAGVNRRDPNSVADETLSSKLWEAIEVLADYLEWERQDYQEAVEGIRQGYEDVKAGGSEPADQFLDEFARKHGLQR
jgi:hypothetical protein